MASKLIPSLGSFLAVLGPLAAQTALDVFGSPQPPLSGYAYCTTVWDPDGAGPLPQRLVVGGDTLLGGAQLIGNVSSTQRVMTWDGSTWQPLGGGPGDSSYGNVSVLRSWNGELFAGGTFTKPGGPNYLARWDGAAWQPVGTGFPIPVDELAVWNGTLVVAGTTSVGGVTTPTLQTWNGVTWSTLPTPPTLRAVYAMTAFEGELIVAGAGATSTQGVLERWSGSSWATSIVAQGAIGSVAVRSSLAVGGSDTLIVGGSFSSIGGVAMANIARTNGAPSFLWSSVGGGLPTPCYSLLVQNSGLVDYAVVARTASATTPMQRYTTSSGSWAPLGSLSLFAVTSFAGSLHGVNAGATEPACHRYDGSQWVPVCGPGIFGDVRAATRSGNDVVIGGTFATISGVAVRGIARWDGSTFTPLGTGMVGSSVDALVTLDNGDIVAGGNFVAAGGVAANHIARWNGTSWSPMGNGFDAPVYALCKMPNGDVIAGGAFTQEVGATVLCSHVARWNGTSWSPLHFGMNNDVLALVVKSDGTLIAGGRFTQAMTTMFSLYHVARWTGSQWAGLGAGMNAPVHGLAARPNGDVVAVGEFTQASLQSVDRIARWNGTSWVSMGAASGQAGIVHAVHTLPDGDVIAGRGFHQPTGQVDAGISRWNGTTWSAFGYLSGFRTADPIQVWTIVQRADGDVVVGGDFHVAHDTMAYAIAALRGLQMPTAVPYGAGCSSAAGLLTIGADTLPWLGTAFRTTTTGVAANSLCLGVIGFAQVAIPLPSLLAEGQAGCSLLAAPDITFVLTNGPGTAHSSFALANTPSLLGAAFFQQTVPLEFGVAGALSAVRSSNALSLVIGTL